MRFGLQKLIAGGLMACTLMALPSIAEAQLYWNTDGSSSTWTATNWGTVLGGPFTTGWTGGSDAVFNADSAITYVTATSFGDVTVANGVTVTVSQAGTVPTGVHVMDVGAGGTLTWASQNYNATTTFTKNGAGIWNLGAISTAYTGGMTLNDGTIIVSGNNSLGGGAATLTINGGTIQSSGSRNYAVGQIDVNADFAITGTGGWTMNMPVNLGAATRTITNAATGTKTWNGVVSGAAGAGLTFEGTGTNVFTGDNTFSGPITINGSETEFTSLASLGSGTAITVDGGRLALRGTFDVSSKDIFLGDAAEFSTPGGSTVIVYDGVLADKPAETGVLVKQGGGVAELGGVSTYTGNTSINNGTIRLTTGDNRLPTGTVLSLGQSADTNLGTLDLNGFNQEVAGLNSTTGVNVGVNTNVITSATAATLTVNGGGTYSDGTAANSGIISGAISLVKSGAGTLTLGGANTYTGTTTISGGTLALSATGSIADSSEIIVQDGGTFDVSAVAGGFDVGSGVFVIGPGVGVKTFVGDLTFGATSTLDVSNVIAGGTGLTIDDTLYSVDFTGFGVANLDGVDGTTPLGIYTLINSDQDFSASGISNWGAAGQVSIGGGKFAYFEQGSLDLVVVPEPSTYALLGCLGAMGLAAYRNRRRSK